MNQQLKAVLLTVLTISVFVIALVELSGVSKTALINKFGTKDESGFTHNQKLSREEQAAQMPKTEIKFDNTEHSFGTINEGDVATHAYHFTNIGKHPLLISRVDASCGCTIPSFTKEPIQPGGEGEVTIQYNSNGHPGAQVKTVMVHSNAQEEAISLSFEVDVKKK